MMWMRYEVIKNTEMRDGAVYRTEVVRHLWLPAVNPQTGQAHTLEEKLSVARSWGGDRLQATMDDPHFGKEPPNPAR